MRLRELVLAVGSFAPLSEFAASEIAALDQVARNFPRRWICWWRAGRRRIFSPVRSSTEFEVDFGSFRLTNAVGGASVPYPTFPAAVLNAGGDRDRLAADGSMRASDGRPSPISSFTRPADWRSQGCKSVEFIQRQHDRTKPSAGRAIRKSSLVGPSAAVRSGRCQGIGHSRLNTFTSISVPPKRRAASFAVRASRRFLQRPRVCAQPLRIFG